VGGPWGQTLPLRSAELRKEYLGSTNVELSEGLLLEIDSVHYDLGSPGSELLG